MASQITRRQPFNTSALTPIDRLFNQMFSRDPFFVEFPLASAIEEGTLALDVSEDDRSVFVRASLPGFAKEDVHVEVNEGVLTINASRKEEKEETGERFYRKERREGSVSRRIALPCAVTEAEARADLRDGVLTLTLPKIRKETPKKISIN